MLRGLFCCAWVLWSLPLVSCASLFTSKTSKVRLKSDPIGCHWETDLGQEGYTPGFVFLPNGRTVSIEFTCATYPGVSLRVVSTPGQGPAIMGNVLFGGVVGALVDAANPLTKIHGKLIEVSFTSTESAPDPAPIP